MTRKDRRFSYWLLACLILAPSTLTAQEFDPVFIGETLSGEIHDGGVSKAQFSSLQQIEVEGFLANEATEQYFTQNFEAEGTFGELKNGIVVTDWKSLAKAMGTTGAVLAGAYSLWRRRRRSELATIRGGNSKAVEALFQKHFLTSKTSLDGNSEKSLVDPSLIPSSNEEWQVWAASRGIPGASVTLAALFLLWKKKVESPTRTVANDMATASRQREWSTQLSSLRDSSKKHQMEIRTEQRQGFNVLLRKLTRSRSTDELARLFARPGTAFNLERSLKASGGHRPGYDVKRLLSGDVRLDEDTETLFASIEPLSKLEAGEGQSLLSKLNQKKADLAKAKDQLKRDQQLVQKLDSLITRDQQSIKDNQLVLDQNKARKDLYFQHMAKRSYYAHMANMFGSRHRRTGRWTPHRNYMRQANNQARTAQQYVRNYQTYYQALSSVSAANRNLATYEQQKVSLPIKIRDAVGAIEQQTNDISSIEARLARNPRSYLDALEVQKQRELTAATHQFNRWLVARTRNGDWHEWWVNKGRHSSLHDPVVVNKHNELLARLRTIQASYLPKLNDLKAEAEDLEAQQSLTERTRTAKVAEYKRLQALIPSFNRVQGFVRQLQKVAPATAYFSELKSSIDQNKDIQQAIKGLSEQASPFTARVASLQRQLAQKNDLSVQEYVSRLDPASQRHWKARNYSGLGWKLKRWRSDMLGNQNYWNHKLAQHMHAVASSRMDYKQNYEQTLRSIAEKALDGEKKRLGGWENLFHHHPDTWAQKTGAWRRELALLQKQQEEWQAAKDKQTALLRQQQQSNLAKAFKSYNWLGKTAVARKADKLTETIVQSELSSFSGATSVEPKSAINKQQTVMAALAMHHAEESQNLDTTIKSLDQLYQTRFHGAVDRLVGQMKGFASPAGKAQTDAIHNQQSKTYWTRKATEYNQENGTELTGSELSKAYHGLNSNGLNASVVAVGKTTPSTPDPTVTVTKVETAELYDGQSSENPQSIQAFETFMATRSLDISSENPASITSFKALLASRTSAEQSHLLNEATAIIQNTKAQATREAVQSLASTNGDLSQGPSSLPIKERVQTQVDDAFSRFIDEKIAKASPSKPITQTSIRSVRIDPNHVGTMKISSDQLIISPKEKGLINALVQNQITTNKEVLKVAANGIVLNGLELTVLAAEGFGKLLKIPSKFKVFSDNSLDPVYYLADQLDRTADKAQAEIDWYVKNVVHSKQLTPKENTIVYFASGMMSVGGVAKSVAKSIIDQSDQLLAAATRVGQDLSAAADDLVNPAELAPINGIPVKFTSESAESQGTATNIATSASGKLDGASQMSRIVQGVPQASLDRLKTRLLGLTDRTTKVQTIKAFGSRVTGVRSQTGLPFDQAASDVDIAVIVGDGKAFRKSERVKTILDEIEADFFSETGTRLELSAHSIDEIGPKTKFKPSDLVDF